MACVCRHNDCGRSSDGERPVFVGTMTVGDLVMVTACVCRHNDCGRSSDGERPVFVGRMTVGV